MGWGVVRVRSESVQHLRKGVSSIKKDQEGAWNTTRERLRSGGGGRAKWIVRTEARMHDYACKGNVGEDAGLVAVEPTTEGVCGADTRSWDRKGKRLKCDGFKGFMLDDPRTATDSHDQNAHHCFTRPHNPLPGLHSGAEQSNDIIACK
jgi:hypothetical protein